MPPEPITADQEELPFEESVRVLIENLPGPVRAYVTGKEPDALVLELTRKYRLHVDQATELHQALLMMLLGVQSPDQFATHLESKAFTEETIKNILTDLNDRVFAPLRKAEREPAIVPAPVRTPLANVPAPLQPAPVAPVFVPPAIPMPAPPAAERIVSAAPEPAMRTMAHDVESMKDGHGAPSFAYSAPAAAAPVSPPAPPQPVSRVEAVLAAPAPAPSGEVPPPHPARTFGAPDPREMRATLQKYGIDPYREVPE